MANTNNPFGLRQLGLNGSSATPTAGQVTLRNAITNTNSTKIFFGDLIKMQTTGLVAQWTATTAVSQCWGVFLGCRYYSTSQNNILYSPYWVATTDASQGTIDAQFLPAILSPPGLFAIQTDATGITSGNIGLNADVVVGTGSTTGACYSGSYLDTTTLCTTSTLPLRIVDMWVNYMGTTVTSTGISAAGAFPGTATGAYNWAVVALNVQQSTGI